MNGKRYLEFDVLRGLLIISVVMGHLDIFANIIYCFHMPAFFILSGVCYKYDRYSIYETFTSVLKKYYIPYWSYFVICRILFHIYDLKYNILAFGKSLYGGNLATDTVAWYTTCLMLTIVFFRLLSPLKYHGLILGIFFLFAHIESWYCIKNNITPRIFMGADIALFSLWYFNIGTVIKEYFCKDRKLKELYVNMVFLLGGGELFV